MPFVVFDALGTLLTFSEVAEGFKQAFLTAPPNGFAMIFQEAVRDYVCNNCVGEFAPLTTFFLASTKRYLARHKIDTANADVMVKYMSEGRMPLAAGAHKSLELLQQSGWTMAIVTNGGRKSVEASLSREGVLDKYFGSGKGVLTCEEIGYGKPRREVYQAVQEHLQSHYNLGGDEKWVLLASHAWDVHGANKSGTRAVGVMALDAQDEAVWAESYERPAIVADNFAAAVAEIVANEKRNPHWLKA